MKLPTALSDADGHLACPQCGETAGMHFSVPILVSGTKCW
jgi:hypothetical protein